MRRSITSGKPERQLLIDVLLEFLPSLPQPTACALADACFLRKYNPGDLIIEEGQPAEGVFLLISGTVEPSVSDAGPNRKRLSFVPISAPGMFGLSASMLEQPSPLSISASTPAEAGLIPRALLMAQLKDFPQASLTFSKLLAEELAGTYSHLSELRRSGRVPHLVSEVTW